MFTQMQPRVYNPLGYGLDAFYLFAYGILAITAVFLILSWSRLAWRRANELNWKQLWRDRYMVISSALTLESIGTGIIFGARVETILVNGDLPVSAQGTIAAVIAAGAGLLALAKFGFLWASHLNRHDKWWLTLLALSTVWTLFVLWWAV